jgi:hypothetical protein
VLTLVGMSLVIFVLMRLAPGDIVDILFASAGYVNEADKKLIMTELGIDKPIWAQYIDWLRAIVTGDLGKSYRYDLPAWQVRRGRARAGTPASADRLPPRDAEHGGTLHRADDRAARQRHPRRARGS